MRAHSLRSGDFFLAREDEFALRHFGMLADDLELLLLENSKPVQATGCWEWQLSRSDNGYGRIYSPVSQDHPYAHRVSLELYKGPFTSAKPHALHKCDNPPCICPDHLFHGSSKDNAADREQKGRGGATRLRAANASEIIAEVFRLRAEGLSQEEIGRRFGKSQGWASMVLRGKGYAAQRSTEAA